jgi:hypothetical protein
MLNASEAGSQGEMFAMCKMRMRKASWAVSRVRDRGKLAEIKGVIKFGKGETYHYRNELK